MYKKGDKVKIIKNRESSKLNINDVGVVTESNNIGLNEIGISKNGKDTLYHSLDEIELIMNKESTPKRYSTDSIDVIDFVKLYDLNFNLGNVVKYVCRNKGTDKEDYKKAIDYLQRELKYLESLDN